MNDEKRPGGQHALERLDPNDRRDHVAAQHWARYEWAASLLPAQRVLDCACGVGYGTHLLAQRGAAQVVGVDLSPDAIAAAQRRYADPRIEFRVADALRLDERELGRFDCIVCLETIEHVPEPQRLLDVFGGLLTPGGRLVVSCPNDAALGASNPFHAWIADLAAVRGWLAARFTHVDEYAETHVVGAAAWPSALAARRACGEPLAPAALRLLDELALERCPGFLFVCGQAPPPRPEHARGALLLDGFEYVRTLEQRHAALYEESAALQRERDHWLTEAQRLAEKWNEQAQAVRRWEEEGRRWEAEAHRLAGAWEKQTIRIHELEAAHNSVFEELQEVQHERDDALAESRRLADAWTAQQKRIEELSAHIDRIWNELQEAVRQQREHAQRCDGLAAELAAARERLARIDRIPLIRLLAGYRRRAGNGSQ